MRLALTAAASLIACAGVAFATGSTPQADGGLIISEVVDGTRAGGNPKYVEITNTSTAAFTFSDGGIIVQSNASGDYNVDVDLTGITINPGQSYVIQSASNDGQAVFEDTYGFAADLYADAFFSNGDDRYIITTSSAGDGTGLVDIHGEDGVDGTGSGWEYLDSYAVRNKDAYQPNGGIFVEADFFHPGPNALEAGGDDAAEKILIAASTTPGTHEWVPAPGSIACLAGAGLLAARRRRNG